MNGITMSIRAWLFCRYCDFHWEVHDLAKCENIHCPRCGLDLLRDHTEEEIAEAKRRKDEYDRINAWAEKVIKGEIEYSPFIME